MTIRTAKPSDASSLAALSIEVWLSTYPKEGVTPAFATFALETFTPAAFVAFIADPAQITLVQEDRDGITGFIRVARASPDPLEQGIPAEIATLYVQPRHQRKGTGQALVQAALQACCALKVPSLWVKTNAENDPALRFYAQQGFADIGTSTFDLEDESYPCAVFARHLA